jgi:hypothetical protein
MKTLRQLRAVILITLLISIFLLTTNLIALHHVTYHHGDCSVGFFHDLYYLNAMFWFLTRFISGVSAPLTGLFLFWRRRSTLSREQLEEKQDNERKNFFGSIFEEFVDISPGFESDSSDDDDGSRKSKARYQ